MRIAVVTTSYPAYPGDPSGHFVEEEVVELRRAGHEVTVVRPSSGGAFGGPGAAARLRERPWRVVDAAAWCLRAVRELQRLDAERVVAHWSLPSGVLASLARASELELVSHGGDVRLLASLPPRVRDAVIRRLVERAQRWRFVSQRLLDQHVAVLSSDLANAVTAIAVVAPSPLGTIDVAHEVRARRDQLKGRKLYVCAARLVASKRIDRVIDYVATQRRETLPGAAPLLVVVGDGPQRAHLEQLASRWMLDARFVGRVTRSEALAWIGAADEVVHASHAEGLSTVVREAEHLGVPVTML
jgi:glycosyltransferase involved in cell wall biosynthesis